MRVLVACEFSGTVRRAFAEAGHDTWSCDLEPSDDDSPRHIQGDVTPLLGEGWDLMIAHPPCTHLTRAGSRWWKDRPEEQERALDFVRLLMTAPIGRIAIENPPGRIGTVIRKADQYIQPWQFGHPEQKMTGLWLKNLPKLRPTDDCSEKMMALPLKQRTRIHYAAPGADRWKVRSRFYPGIARAMAEQWGGCDDL